MYIANERNDTDNGNGICISKENHTMNLDDFKNLLTFAIQNEIEAQAFYRKVAEKASDPFLKRLFGQFVEEERKHQQILENFQASDPSEFHFTDVPDFHLAETEPTPTVEPHMKPIDAFGLAMKNEETAMRLYMSIAEATSDPGKKKIFQELATMEREHKHKMEKAFVDIGYPEVW